jgi:DNA-binding GntR family transcriptional regulator
MAKRKHSAEPALSPLQLRVAREIVAHVRRGRLPAGEHVAESQLAEQLGTSRTPVNQALRFLAATGALSHDPNRGFFLAQDAEGLEGIARRLSAAPDDPLYLKIAEDRLSHRLADVVNEADLMRRYRASRSAVRKVLLRVQQEGWIEKSIGHGWCFQAMIDSAEAYDESYVFRAALEPTGVLGSGFLLDPAELEALRREQRLIVDGGYRTMTPIELFESNSRFHETIARWSRNRFLLQSVRRIDQLRRLVEYRQASQRKARQGQADEHLEILGALERGDLLEAATLLRGHLERARRSKVYASEVFAGR